MVNTRLKRYGSQTDTKKCLPNTPKKRKYEASESETETAKQETPSKVDAASATLTTSSILTVEEQFPPENNSPTAAESGDNRLMTPAVSERNDDENVKTETESGKTLRMVENVFVGMEQNDDSKKEINTVDTETSKEIQEVSIEDDTAIQHLSPALSDVKTNEDAVNCDIRQSTSVTSNSDPKMINEEDGIEITGDSDEAFRSNTNFRSETESGASDEIRKETDHEIKTVEDGHLRKQAEEVEHDKGSQTVQDDGSSESSNDVAIIDSVNNLAEKKLDEESSGKLPEFVNSHSCGSKTDTNETSVSVKVAAQEEKLFSSTVKSLEAGGAVKQSIITSAPREGQKGHKKPIFLAGAEIMRNIPRGITKSGRVWKGASTKFSSNIKTKGLKQSFEKKQKLFEELKRVKEISRARKDEIQMEKAKNKERIARVRKMREENAKKAEIVQVITNTAKLKRMTKKQLRNIEKRDTTKVCRI